MKVKERGFKPELFTTLVIMLAVPEAPVSPKTVSFPFGPNWLLQLAVSDQLVVALLPGVACQRAVLAEANCETEHVRAAKRPAIADNFFMES